MNSDNSSFENLAFNPVSRESVQPSEVVDPDENFSKSFLLI